MWVHQKRAAQRAALFWIGDAYLSSKVASISTEIWFGRATKPTALRVWTLRTIGRAWNVRVVVPDEAQVVSSGPYAWIRHPNYLVVILEVAALPLLHTAWVSALGLSLLNGVVLWRRIHTEERALGQLAGWREAMAQRARLIPGVF